MFRATLLAVVLTLSVGQEARLLCRMWCHPAGAAEGACHHRTDSSESPRLQTGVLCDEALTATRFLREEIRRGVESRFADVVFVVFRHHVTPAMIGAPNVATAHQARPPSEHQPLVTALRI